MSTWTLERMKNAKPKQKTTHSTRSGRCREKGSEAKIVPDEDLKHFPCQSVGRLFFTTDSGDYYGSGYVANLVEGNKKTIITAAHNLWDKGDGVSRDLYFIPGMVDDADKGGIHYGGYKDDWIDWCPDWNPDSDPHWDDKVGNPNYDFGVVQLAPRLSDGKDVGEVVQPFVVEWDFKLKAGMKWMTLAYPADRGDNPSKKMMKQPGAFSDFNNGYVKKECYGQKLGCGASGGVWVLDMDDGRKVACGVHVVSDGGDGTSWSPYFTRSILPKRVLTAN